MRPNLPRFTGLRLLAAVGLLFVDCATLAAAQSTAPQITVESVLRYLQKDLFLSPGVGFRKVQIGQSFNHVEQAWGQPHKKLESSEAGVSNVWIYTVGRDSEIAVAGGANVRVIRVLGSINSPFASADGAQFGMTPHQVITIYGPPSDGDDLTRLSYPEKGIAFAFEHGVMRAMQVTSPNP